MVSSSAEMTKLRRVAGEGKSNQAPPEVPKHRCIAEEGMSNQAPPVVAKRRRGDDEGKSNQAPSGVPKRRLVADEGISNQARLGVSKRRRVAEEGKSNKAPQLVVKCRRVANEGKSKQAPPEIPKGRVGLLFDERMCNHVRLEVEQDEEEVEQDEEEDPGEEEEVQIANRIRAIWKKLNDNGITERCRVLTAYKALDKHLKYVHSLDYINSVRSSSTLESPEKHDATTKDFDIFSESAFLEAGSVQKASRMVAQGWLDSAIAIVRPSGHHAEKAKAMGFCYFNNVAIAASYLLNKTAELNIRKILIVDWDVHHGNGTQKMFYANDKVLTFSVHRYDSGKFFPRNNNVSHLNIGLGSGKGYSINVPWQHEKLGDADYLAVWKHILIPVATAFNPDMILISAGFDRKIILLGNVTSRQLHIQIC